MVVDGLQKFLEVAQLLREGYGVNPRATLGSEQMVEFEHDKCKPLPGFLFEQLQVITAASDPIFYGFCCFSFTAFTNSCKPPAIGSEPEFGESRVVATP